MRRMLFQSPSVDGVDLDSYDLILVNSSGGKDSQAMLHKIACLAAAADLSDRVVVVHADLGHVEWEGTRALAEHQANIYGFRFEVVSRSVGLLGQVRQRHHTLQQREEDVKALAKAGIRHWHQLANCAGAEIFIGDPNPRWREQAEPERRAEKLRRLARGRAKSKPEGLIDFGVPVPWPDASNRYCTSDQKTSQVAKLITRLHREAGSKKGWRLLNCLGMRAEESSSRAKKPVLSRDASTNKSRHVDRWLPIHGWSVERVWQVINESGVPHHPAYDLGMSRLSCRFCVLASRKDLEISARANPGLLAEYIAMEEETGYAFRSGMKLANINEPAPVRRKQLSLFDGSSTTGNYND